MFNEQCVQVPHKN